MPRFRMSLALLLLVALAPAAAQSPTRKPVQGEADLPQHRYALSVPTASELLDGGPAFDALAAEVGRNLDATLRDYDIHDAATRRDLYATRLDLELLARDAGAIERTCRDYLPLLDSPADRLLGCTRYPVLAGARTAAQVENDLYARLSPLPWDVVGDAVVQARTGTAMPGARASALGVLRQVVDPALEANGSIDEFTARRIIETRARLSVVEPMRDALVAAYDRYIAANRRERPDIWREREVALDAAGLAPVTIAVWDQGIDPARFQGRLWNNPDETTDGRDDDGNGFVDDLHGIGFDADGAYTPALLGDFARMSALPEARVRALVAGRADILAGIASPQARAFAAHMDALQPEQAAALMEAMTAYGFHAHGTMMADVAMRGNPAACLLAIRTSNDLWKMPPPVPSMDDMARSATRTRRIVDYLQAKGVRVVNISWGATPGDYERLLEMNGIGESPEARRAQATRLFEASATPLRDAIRNAPGILFVVAAGNEGSDVAFTDDLTGTLDLPNVLVVGAADRAGQVAGFSNSGDNVRVYAPGVQVSAALPGEGELRTDGTSIATPAVAALAGQLFALAPELTPAQVVALILQGGTRSRDGKHLLMHPRASIALLRDGGHEK